MLENSRPPKIGHELAGIDPVKSPSPTMVKKLSDTEDVVISVVIRRVNTT
jgi:hypothetical protein